MMKEMRLCILVGIGLIASQQAWAVTSATLLKNAGGNVGIGTATPQAQLEVGSATSMIAGSTPVVAVDGNMYVDGTVYGTYFYGNGSLLTGVSTISGLTDNYIPRALGTTDIENSIIFDSGTNIGIGSALPQAKLDVEGTVYFGNGNVGIGTAKPTKQLELTQNMALPATTNAAPYGVIYKGVDRFIHDFTYGNNGSVTPDGFNTFVGVKAGNLTMGSTASDVIHSSRNTAIGVEALQANTTGYNNTASGYEALFSNTTGHDNTAHGALALYTNVSGNENTASGQSALVASTGNANTASGYYALAGITSGSNNSGFGRVAGRYIADGATANTTGANSLFLGYDTRAMADGETNQIVIGASTIGLGSNSVVLGNSSIVTTALRGNVGINSTIPQARLDVSGDVFVNAAGNIGIGTAKPQAQLEVGSATSMIAGSAPVVAVDGNLYVDGTIYGTYFYGDGSLLTGISVITGLTDNYIPRANGATDIEDSIIFDSGTNIGIGSALPQAKLDVEGTVYFGNGNVGIGTAKPTKQLELTQNMALPATTNAAPYGVIYKGVDRFIHDFTYGNNGSVTPDGFNTFVGVKAGNLTMGSTADDAQESSRNTAIGYEALTANTTGYNNTAIGYQALDSNTTGHDNTAHGGVALQANVSGNENTAVGVAALYANTGSDNTAIGYYALYGNTSGSNNSGLGSGSGRYITDGATANTTGADSLFLGYDTRAKADGETNQIVIGYSNIGLGSNSVVLGNSSIATTALRGNVGINSTAPQARLDVSGALFVNTSGNVGIGTANPTKQLELTQNISLPTTQFSAQYGVIYKGVNRFIHDFSYGVNGGGITPAGENTFVGVGAGNFTMGGTATETYHASGNTAIGYGAMTNVTTGYYNSGLGDAVLRAITTGYQNSAMGYTALAGLTTGHDNVAVGSNAGRYIYDGATLNTTSNTSIYLGSNAYGLANGDENEIVIGYNTVGLGSNTVVLGNSNNTTTALRGNVGINSTAPQARLDVEGTVYLGNGNVGIGTAKPTKQLELTQNMSIPTTQNSAKYGIIYKGEDTFIHDFAYGNNGSVTTVGRNTFVGVNAGNLTMGATATATSEGSYNTGVGYEALQAVTTGRYLVGVGYRAAYASTSGGIGVAVGAFALEDNQTGNNNVAYGYAALSNITSGSTNVAVGTSAGAFIADGATGNTTGGTSVFIGAETKALANGQANQIVIGYNATGLGANTVVLGNSDIVTTALRGNVGINSTAPQARLDVEGTVYFGNGNVGIGTAVPGALLAIADSCIQLKSPDNSLTNCCVDNSDNFTCTGL